MHQFHHYFSSWQVSYVTEKSSIYQPYQIVPWDFSKQHQHQKITQYHLITLSKQSSWSIKEQSHCSCEIWTKTLFSASSNDQSRLISSKYGNPHWSTPNRIVFRSNQLNKNQNHSRKIWWTEIQGMIMTQFLR